VQVFFGKKKRTSGGKREKRRTIFWKGGVEKKQKESRLRKKKKNQGGGSSRYQKKATGERKDGELTQKTSPPQSGGKGGKLAARNVETDVGERGKNPQRNSPIPWGVKGTRKKRTGAGGGRNSSNVLKKKRNLWRPTVLWGGNRPFERREKKKGGERTYPFPRGGAQGGEEGDTWKGFPRGEKGGKLAERTDNLRGVQGMTKRKKEGRAEGKKKKKRPFLRKKKAHKKAGNIEEPHEGKGVGRKKEKKVQSWSLEGGAQSQQEKHRTGEKSHSERGVFLRGKGEKKRREVRLKKEVGRVAKKERSLHQP